VNLPNGSLGAAGTNRGGLRMRGMHCAPRSSRRGSNGASSTSVRGSGGSALRGDWRTAPLRPQMPAVGGADTRAPLQRSSSFVSPASLPGSRGHEATSRGRGVGARRPWSTRPDRDLSSKPQQPLHAETPSPRRHRPAQPPQPLSDPRSTQRQQARPAPRPGSARPRPPATHAHAIHTNTRHQRHDSSRLAAYLGGRPPSRYEHETAMYSMTQRTRSLSSLPCSGPLRILLISRVFAKTAP